jgi:hypothetical protein
MANDKSINQVALFVVLAAFCEDDKTANPAKDNSTG